MSEFGMAPGMVVCVRVGEKAPPGYTQKEWSLYQQRVGVVLGWKAHRDQVWVWFSPAEQVLFGQADLVYLGQQ